MRAEIIGVGTELLLGQIPNTNAQVISQALAEIGVDVYFHTVVGDNLGRASSTVATALGRSDVVIITGGLGPTPDDLTREAVAAAVGVGLERDARLERALRDFFQARGREMPEDNLRQADVPVGATPIEPEGTAPGFFLDRDGAVVFALPGVPWEMWAMLTKTVLPALRARSPGWATISREVLVVGLGESHTHQRIADIVEAQTNPTIAYLASGGQVRVRVTAKAADEPAALALIAPVEEAIRARLTDHAVPGHHRSVGAALAALLAQAGAKVAVAESLTGGLVAAEMTASPGASAVFLGSLVCYSTASKRDLAGVDEDVLSAHGPVSEQTARALAEGAAESFGADMGLSTTGVAGPDEFDGHPVGEVFVAASFKGRSEARRIHAYGDRDNIRRIAVTSVLDLGRRLLAARG